MENLTGRTYRVKGVPGTVTHIELLHAVDGGYETRITSSQEFGSRESFEYISNHLLDVCVRTGYLIEESEPVAVH